MHKFDWGKEKWWIKTGQNLFEELSTLELSARTPQQTQQDRSAAREKEQSQRNATQMKQLRALDAHFHAC